mmetsp:Transcript_26426/g.29447  ORF Transcript_26426/g.29447 Transcript_26426/m.29447 type:complete len:105 (+) Transcript_26426:140-454(+)
MSRRARTSAVAIKEEIPKTTTNTLSLKSCTNKLVDGKFHWHLEHKEFPPVTRTYDPIYHVNMYHKVKRERVMASAYTRRKGYPTIFVFYARTPYGHDFIGGAHD